MENIDLLKTAIWCIVSLVGIVTAYYRSIHVLEHKFRDKIEEQIRQVADLKIEMEKLKSKDELQQQVIDQLKKHLLDNLPAFYKALDSKDTKK